MIARKERFIAGLVVALLALTCQQISCRKTKLRDVVPRDSAVKDL